jgi:hypothetical protein
MTSEYRPLDKHASRAEANSQNIQVLTVQSPHNNQIILTLIKDEPSEDLHPMDNFAFSAECDDIPVQKNQILSIMADFSH